MLIIFQRERTSVAKRNELSSLWKTIVRLVSHLQKTHKWTKEQSKEFKNSASHCKAISGDEHEQMINDDIARPAESWSMEPSPSSPPSQSIFEPLRKLSWEEMDKLDYDHKQKMNRNS